MNEAKEIICKKCQATMTKDSLFPPRSLDTFSGTYNITDSSACTTVTTYPYGTSTDPTSSGTGHQANDIFRQRITIKIRNYTCPACGWRTQVRE